MRIATFNLYNFAEPGTYYYEPGKGYGDRIWADKIRFIEGMLREIDADVVAFQEVFSVEPLMDICRSVGLDRFAAEGPPPRFDAATSVFSSPVNLVASRLPMTRSPPVGFDPDMATALTDLLARFGVEQPPGFSRMPVRVRIDDPALGPVTVYAAHLKSKRPMTPPTPLSTRQPWRARVDELLQRLSRGSVAALLQRGIEAAALREAVAADLAGDRDGKIVVIGDLNDTEDSVPIDALAIDRPVGVIRKSLSDALPADAAPVPAFVSRMIHAARLNDAHVLRHGKGARTPTFYFSGRAQVIDYIFVSNVFNPNNRLSEAHVGHFAVKDAHLFNREGRPRGSGNPRASDHAVVVAELAAGRPANAEESLDSTDPGDEPEANL